MSHFYEALWAACRKRGRSAPSNLFAEAHAGGWESVALCRGRGWAASPPLPCGPAARLPFYVEALRPPHLQGDSFYGERVTRKPGGGRSPATPLRYPPPPREKVSLRSPLSDGGKASSGTEVPIQEATTVNRWLSRALIDRSPGKQQSFCPRVSPPAVQPAGIIYILLSTVQAHVPQKGGRAQAFCRFPLRG